MHKGKIIVSICLVLLVVFSAFLPVLKNGFVNWDDDKYINENIAIKQLSLKNTGHILTSFYMGNFHPVTMLTYALGFYFSKLNPLGYHIISLILHLLNCILVFVLMLRLTKKVTSALIATLLWGIHPINVESVAWISEFKGLICALFYLWAILCYISYLRDSKKKKFYGLALLLFLLSLLAKPVAISLPLMLFLIDYFFKRKDGAIFIDKVPFFLLSFIFGAISVYAQYLSGAVRAEKIFNLADKIMIASYGIIFYLHKIFIPLKLACLYPYPQRIAGFLPPKFFISFLLIVFLTLIILFSKNYSRKLIFSSLFFLIAIFPALQFVPISDSIVADRYVYVASIGIFYILAEGLIWLYAKSPGSLFFNRIVIPVILVVTIGTLFLLTQTRCRAWGNGITLWSDVLENYPDVAVAYNNRGILWHGKKEYAKAHQDFLNAISREPHYVAAYLNLGNLYRDTGKTREAISVFGKIPEMEPQNPEAYFNIANIYDELLGKNEEALVLYKKTLMIKEDHFLCNYYLGLLYEKLNSKGEAIKVLNKTLEQDPGYLLSYIALCRIYEGLNNKEEQVRLYKKAIANNLDYFDAYFHIANLYRDVGNNKKAIMLYRKAISINPASGPAYNNLAEIYYYKRQYDLATRYFDKAIALGHKVEPKFLELLKPYRE